MKSVITVTDELSKKHILEVDTKYLLAELSIWVSSLENTPLEKIEIEFK